MASNNSKKYKVVRFNNMKAWNQLARNAVAN